MAKSKKLCYICGKSLYYGVEPSKSIIDRKERDVHSSCKKRREKTLAELKEFE